MPNIADFLVPLKQAMDDYTNENYDSMQRNIDNYMKLISAHRGVAEAKNQYAQALESGAKAKTEGLLSPYKIATEQYRGESYKQLGEERSQRGKYWSQRYEQEVVKAENAESAQKAQESMISDYIKDNPGTTREQAYAQLIEKPKLEKVSSAVDVNKARTELIKTQTKVEESKVSQPTDYQAIIDMTPELAGTPPTKDAITTRLKVLRDIAVTKKDAKQLEYLDSRIGLTEAQEDVAQQRATLIGKQIDNFNSGKGLSPSMQLKAMQIELIRQKEDEGYSPEDAFNAIMNPIDMTDLRTLINGTRKQLETTTDVAEKQIIKESLERYESLLSDQLKRYESPDANIDVDVSGDTATITAKQWDIVKKDRKGFLSKLYAQGMRKAQFVDANGKKLGYAEFNASGNITRQINAGVKIPTAQPKQVAPTGNHSTQQQVGAEAQKIIAALKASGVNSISQVDKDIIDELKRKGLYNEVLRGLGGR